MELEVFLHESPARSLEQIVRYLTGDAHDQSKVVIQVKDDAGQFHFIPFPFTPFSAQQSK